LAEIPASPPNSSGNISAAAATSSPNPSVIIANGVPDWRVLAQPSGSASSSPARPPSSGTRLTGSTSQPAASARSAWMAA